MIVRTNSECIMAGAPPPARGTAPVGARAAAGQLVDGQQHVVAPARAAPTCSLASGGASTPQRLELVGPREHLAGRARPARTWPSPSSTIRAARLARPADVVGDGQHGQAGAGPDAGRAAAGTPACARRPGRWSARRAPARPARRRAAPPSASRCLPPWLSSHGLVCSSPREAEELDRPGTSSTGSGRQRAELEAELRARRSPLSSNSISSAACSSSATCAACSNTLPGRTGWPRKRTGPALGVPRPTARPVSVDLPEPLAPIIATHSPSSTGQA